MTNLLKEFQIDDKIALVPISIPVKGGLDYENRR